MLSPVHTSNNIEATGIFVACCFDIVAGVDRALVSAGRTDTPTTAELLYRRAKPISSSDDANTSSARSVLLLRPVHHKCRHKAVEYLSVFDLIFPTL